MTSKRLRFTSDDDLALLREVVGQNPLQNPENWNIVQANVLSITGKEFLVQTLKDHLMLLLTTFKKKSDGDRFKSGIEEVFTEKDVLLQELVDLCKEFEMLPLKTKRLKLSSKERQIAALGRQSREEIAVDASIERSDVQSGAPTEDIIISVEGHDFFEPSVPSCSREVVEENFIEEIQVDREGSPIEMVEIPDQSQRGRARQSKRSTSVKRTRKNKSVLLRKNALEYLTQKNDQDREIKVREITLQEDRAKLESRRIAIEEKKLEMEMEMEDRKRRNELDLEKLKIDLRQRADLQTQVASQQRLIDSLLKRLEKYEG